MFLVVSGVLQAVDAVISHLKSMSRNVTTPEEIAQVWGQPVCLICWQLFSSCCCDYVNGLLHLCEVMPYEVC